MIMLIRHLWTGLGCIATGLGIAGIVLPLVPTTPFLLLAAFAFARSSPTLHAWLLTHPRLGRFILDWQEYGCISRPLKLGAMLVMIVALALGAWMGLSYKVLAAQSVVFVAVAAFILTRPNTPAD